MLAHYYYIYINDDPKEKLTFDNDESMQIFLINNPQENPALNGILFHTLLSGIKIEYNTHTGHVKAGDAEYKNISFSDDAFEARFIPIKDALCWRAKYDLLSKLYMLNDPGINGIIEMNQLKFGGQASNNSHAVLNRTLIQIRKYIQPREHGLLSLSGLLFSSIRQTPTQQAVYFAMKEQNVYQQDGLDRIKSTAAVTKIMQTIENEIKKNESYSVKSHQSLSQK